jgi:hypothetical protein
MYGYMVLKTKGKRLFRDFLAYYKRHPDDELYYVSINNPKLLQYLEEFIERRLN